jgi:hypothetical protein
MHHLEALFKEMDRQIYTFLFVKGSVQRKLRTMLLYIIQKLFTRRWTAEHLNLIFLKGQFTIYIKPL